MAEALQSYAPSLPRSSVKPSAISAIVKTIPAKQPLTAPVPPVVIPPLPQLPPESYYPKTPPVPPPVVPVTVPVPTVSLRPKPVGRKVCRAYWAMVPWDSVIDGHKAANISWLYRLMFLRNRKKPEAGKLFPIRLTTCSVITKKKTVVYHTVPPSRDGSQIPPQPSPLPPPPPPPPVPPVGATYRYGYMDMLGLCELNPLNGYDEVLPTVISTQSPLLKGQWLYEQDARIAVVYQGNVLVYSLSFISPPLLANTWPLPDTGSGERLGFYDPNSNCACAVYSSLSTPTGSNYGTVNVNTGATTATFYALPSTTNNGVSLIFAQASERCSPTNNFFATISSMFWNGGAVGATRICKHSKATGILLGDSGNDPVADYWKVLNYSLVYVADREEYIACGRSAAYPAALGFNVFNSSLALIQSIPIGEIYLAVLAGSRNGGASIFFTQSTTVLLPSVSTLTRYAHNGVEYVATASIVLSSSAQSADWSSTMNVLWVSHYMETKLYHGTTLALIDTVINCWGANTLAPD